MMGYPGGMGDAEQPEPLGIAFIHVTTINEIGTRTGRLETMKKARNHTRLSLALFADPIPTLHKELPLPLSETVRVISIGTTGEGIAIAGRKVAWQEAANIGATEYRRYHFRAAYPEYPGDDFIGQVRKKQPRAQRIFV
jgi:hypothetical protein